VKELLTTVAVSVLLERPEVRSTRSKDTISVKRLCLEIVETEMRRVPSTAGETTVEPLFSTVGCVGTGIAVATVAGMLVDADILEIV
jgi:hypothetical protein